MHRYARAAVCSVAVAAAASLAAALPAGAHEGHDHERQSVAIKFAAMAGDDPVACGSPIPGLGSTSQTAQLQDLRFFVSEAALVKRGGRTVPIELRANSSFRVTDDDDAVTLIDLENATGSCAEEGTRQTNAWLRGTVPHGEYVGVRFTVGVPSALNHTDAPAAPAPLNSAAMAWSWQFGRKFMKIELADPAGAAGTWTAKSFFVHLGSTGCTGDPATGQTARCTTPNRAAVRLKSFDPTEQQIAVDVKSLVAGNDITINRGDAPGCMSSGDDPECAGVMRSLGIGWKADGTGNGLSPANRQTVFRAIDR